MAAPDKHDTILGKGPGDAEAAGAALRCGLSSRRQAEIVAIAGAAANIPTKDLVNLRRDVGGDVNWNSSS